MSVPLYHGTRAGFRGPGGLLLPGDQLEPRVDNYELERSDAVYVTPDRRLAEVFAVACPGKGRPRVLTVLPCGPLERDDSTVDDEEHESYRTPYARVLRTELVQP